MKVDGGICSSPMASRARQGCRGYGKALASAPLTGALLARKSVCAPGCRCRRRRRCLQRRASASSAPISKTSRWQYQKRAPARSHSQTGSSRFTQLWNTWRKVAATASGLSCVMPCPALGTTRMVMPAERWSSTSGSGGELSPMMKARGIFRERNSSRCP